MKMFASLATVCKNCQFVLPTNVHREFVTSDFLECHQLPSDLFANGVRKWLIRIQSSLRHVIHFPSIHVTWVGYLINQTFTCCQIICADTASGNCFIIRRKSGEIGRRARGAISATVNWWWWWWWCEVFVAFTPFVCVHSLYIHVSNELMKTQSQFMKVSGGHWLGFECVVR